VHAGAKLLTHALERKENPVADPRGRRLVGREIERAEAHFQRVLGADPLCSDCWHLLGLSKFERAKTTLAEIAKTTDDDDDDDEPKQTVLLAETMILPLEGEAVAWIGNAVLASPSTPVYRDNAVSVLLRFGRAREAMQQLRNVLYLEPTIERFAHAMRVFVEHQSWEDAVEVFAVSLPPPPPPPTHTHTHTHTHPPPPLLRPLSSFAFFMVRLPVLCSYICPDNE
jgi:hypothetical protein